MSEKHKFNSRGILTYCPNRDSIKIKQALKLLELVEKRIPQYEECGKKIMKDFETHTILQSLLDESKK